MTSVGQNVNIVNKKDFNFIYSSVHVINWFIACLLCMWHMFWCYTTTQNLVNSVIKYMCLWKVLAELQRHIVIMNKTGKVYFCGMYIFFRCVLCAFLDANQFLYFFNFIHLLQKFATWSNVQVCWQWLAKYSRELVHGSSKATDESLQEPWKWMRLSLRWNSRLAKTWQKWIYFVR
jgi:hypothetical protein